MISKKAMFERPPPGPGLVTVTEAVPATATSETTMVAVNRVLATNVVVLGLPFHFTIDPGKKPMPFTVRVNPAPPGVALSGISGWLIAGTGATPVPLRVTVWGLPEALSVMVTVPVRVPAAVGVNVTLMVQVRAALLSR